MSVKLLEKVGDTAVSAIGNAAGTVVAPKTGLTKIVGVLSSPGALTAAAAVAAAYVLGRRATR